MHLLQLSIATLEHGFKINIVTFQLFQVYNPLQ